MLEDIGADHVSWLLAAANTFLDQQKSNRAIVLLELLGLVDPDNVQGQTMLAYAFLRQRDRRRCRAILGRLNRRELSEQERAVVQMLSVRLENNAQGSQPPPRRP